MCHAALRLKILDERRVDLSPEYLALAKELGRLDADFNRFVESGALLCDHCRVVYPIVEGLPVLIPYTTPTHAEFEAAHKALLAALPQYKWPAKTSVPGEEFVMRSFAAEWRDYDYDGVIWDLSYEDHEKRFLAEIGEQMLHDGQEGTFVEIGCGLGLTTLFAAKDLRCDAIGVDLSLAVLRATAQFKDNPFLHFVQGSAFYLPLRPLIANVIYSHGVLHHTYSTQDAVTAVTQHCARGGWIYLWLYGSGSKKGSVARRFAFALEETVRPSIARHLSAPPVKATLSVMACAYLAVNFVHRLRDPSVEKYTFANAVHAARDRFTPMFAHRHDYPEVAGWLRNAGFNCLEKVDWRTMPTANQANYRRNTGVRGKRVTT
jgi:SAM-dependent methyltransferase/uncharacterized protein YbaR (Trm112 family)